MTIRSRLTALAFAAALSVTACTSDEGQAAADATNPTTDAPTPTTAPAPGDSSTGPSASTTGAGPATSGTSTGPAGAGCATGTNAVPAGATQGPVADVDGDGRPDTAWIVVEPSGTTRTGIVTAAGGGFEREFRSASPVTRSILVIGPDGRPDSPPLILASDGRLVQLWAVINCAVVDVLNKSGEPYQFSLGFTDAGTGVGCLTVDGHRELVGFDTGAAQGDTVPFTATVITVTGNQARNGTASAGTLTRGKEDDAIERLHGVSCDDLPALTATEG